LDSFVPLGAAANLVLLSEDQIEKAALELSARDPDAHRPSEDLSGKEAR
jgi:hypothetical protein